MKKMLLTGLVALGILAAACSKDESTPGVTDGATTSIKVSVQGAPATGRAIGNPGQTLENTVHSFAVYVFNYTTGALEKKQPISSGLTGEVPGLSVAFRKRVVVFVNEPAGFPAVTNYSDFSAAASMINLDTQVPGDFQTTGLFMSGEYGTAVTLEEGKTATITVPVSRIVSKVRLGSLTVNPESGISLDDFTLNAVSIQKARDNADPMGLLRTTGFSYVGGFEGSVSSPGGATKPYLRTDYTLPGGYTPGTALTPNAYFYVFPNDNTDTHATMMTLYGTYQGNDTFFSFYINDTASGSGENATDGTWITRNKVYTLNVTLRKLGSGSENPDVTNELASLEVTVDVADWESELIQDVEW